MHQDSNSLFVRGTFQRQTQGWSDWTSVPSSGQLAGVAAGRYAQWRAEFRGGGAIDSVTLNYLPRNVAPVVDDIAVATGARISVNSAPQLPPTGQVIFPSGTRFCGAGP